MTLLLEIAKVSGLALIEDGGRPGRMHEGIPPGGALVPELLSAANRAARNGPACAAIETSGEIVLIARGGSLVLGDEEGRALWLGEGESLVFPGDRSARVRYLAARGGVDVETVLGGKGTLLSAGLGGFRGRALCAGDLLVVGHEPPIDAPPWTAPAHDAIRVVRGPDLDRAVWDAFVASTWTVSPASDRTGTRLTGPALMRAQASGASMPMVAGAIELTPAGEPIVLGPDHPTTGGYPVIGILARADLGAFHRIPFGGRATFRAATVEEARDAWASRMLERPD